MSRVSYANRRFMPHAEAMTPIEDRGLQFADGVYEVMEYFNHVILDLKPHLDRLERSLKEMRIPAPMSRATLTHQLNELLRRNHRRHGLIYLQVNRGHGPRDHAIRADMKPLVIMHVMPRRTPPKSAYEKGIAVTLATDIRWQRCDIKTVGLLGNILMKADALAHGAKDVLILDASGNLRESSSSNVFIVTRKGVLATPPLSHHILPGVVRANIIRYAKKLGIAVEERAIGKKELLTAAECFITNTSAHAMPVTMIERTPIGKGAGPVTRRIINHYHQTILDLTGEPCPML